MKGITTFLWFDGQAEEAARYYASVFPNSSVGAATRYGEAGAKASGQPKGSVMTIPFTLDGKPFVALNGGPIFKFNESVSFVVNCDTQAEIDQYWDKLAAGGQEAKCGWLKDKFGLSWQVVPSFMGELMQDAGKAAKVMEAVLTMKKLDIAALRKAAA